MELEYYRQYEPIFGEYSIKKEIGEGSSGKVFEIERNDIAGTFSAALKAITIPRNQNQIDMVTAQQKDPSVYYRSMAMELQTEVELMAELKGHTNIVSYENHKFIQHKDGVGWDILIQMELLTPLYRYANLHELSEKDVIKLGIDICSALELCHSHNIIHRDVKPENIFVTMDGDFKLGDFGIAKVFDETRSGTRIGTDSFMAPEVFNYRKYGTSVDIYSLGMVMYTLLNRHMIPFEVKSSVATRGRRLEANNRRMMGEKIPKPENAGDALSDVILKALEYKTEDRYQSAAEMKAALLGVLSGNTAASGGKKRNLKKKIMIVMLSVLVIAAGFFAAIPREVTDITGIDDTVTILYGDTLEPDYAIEPERFSDEPMTFKTSEKSVASVDKSGKITAGKIGETDLIIGAKGFEKRVKVIVKAKVTAITGVKDKYQLEEGSSLKLKPSLSPEKYSREKVKYSVKDSSVATVGKNGRVTAVSAGSTAVTISAGGKTRKIIVVVKKKQIEKAEPEYIPQPVQQPVEKPAERKKDSSVGDDNSLEWE